MKIKYGRNNAEGGNVLNSDFCVAVHGLVFLKHKGCTISSEELAENICTNPARVRKVMAKLKKVGLVQTKEGKVGGYTSVEQAEDITLYRVAEALDIRFVEASWRIGDSDMNCMIASGMADVMDEIYLNLNDMCLEKLKTITICEIERKLIEIRAQKQAKAAVG